MDVKKTLRQYRSALLYAVKCFRELDEVRNEYLQSPKLDGMPKAGGEYSLDIKLARLDALEKRAEKARNKALEYAESIERMIDALDEYASKSVIKQRYIYGESWAKIATLLHYSESTVKRIHGRAIDELRQKGF